MKKRNDKENVSIPHRPIRKSYDMPAAEETTYLIKVMPDTTQDFLTRDVDLLVSQIKENLRLSTLKAKSTISQKNRPSPYRVPSQPWADPTSCDVCGHGNANDHHHRHHHHPHHHHHHHQLHHHHYLHHHHHHHCHHCHRHNQLKRSSAREEEDPYELLQELLREGGLIKEAVKRLHANLDQLGNTELDDLETEDIEDEDQSRIYQRKPYFYESEDEPLPQVYQPLEL